MKYIIYTIVFLGNSAFSNATLSYVVTTERIRHAIVPLVETKWNQVNQLYCPSPLLEEDLQYSENESNNLNKVFTLVFRPGSSFAYCADGLPITCSIFVAFVNGKWNTEEAFIKNCKSIYGEEN